MPRSWVASRQVNALRGSGVFRKGSDNNMRILIIGGGVFLGRELLAAALRRGHALSVFNRGRARQQWPAGVRVLTGDRRGDLAGLAAAGPWDAVIA